MSVALYLSSKNVNPHNVNITFSSLVHLNFNILYEPNLQTVLKKYFVKSNHVILH